MSSLREGEPIGQNPLSYRNCGQKISESSSVTDEVLESFDPQTYRAIVESLEDSVGLIEDRVLWIDPSASDSLVLDGSTIEYVADKTSNGIISEQSGIFETNKCSLTTDAELSPPAKAISFDGFNGISFGQQLSDVFAEDGSFTVVVAYKQLNGPGAFNGVDDDKAVEIVSKGSVLEADTRYTLNLHGAVGNSGSTSFPYITVMNSTSGDGAYGETLIDVFAKDRTLLIGMCDASKTDREEFIKLMQNEVAFVDGVENSNEATPTFEDVAGGPANIEQDDTPFFLGASLTYQESFVGLRGLIYELMVFSRVLTNSELDLINRYIKIKYRLPYRGLRQF